MVVDYRKLNNLTKRDAYPLLHIEDTFTLLLDSKWFTVLDLKSGYYQLEVEPADRPKTAFTTPFGTWHFRRMPQGLTNSPAAFQQTTEKVMEGIDVQEVVAFLDDLTIFSDSLLPNTREGIWWKDSTGLCSISQEFWRRKRRRNGGNMSDHLYMLTIVQGMM